MRTSACNETNIITLAWAVPVDAPSLGARLEAYAETRAASHIFTLCVKHAVGSRMGQLPPEIVQNVCSALWDSAFDAKIEDWRKAHACLSNACKTFDHFSEDALEGLKEDFLAVVKGEGLDVLTVDERFREWLEDMGMCTDRHEEVVLEHVYKLRATLCEHTKSTMYKRGQQKLAEDFGVETHLNVFCHFEPDIEYPLIEHADVSAFLILSPCHIPMTRKVAFESAEFSAMQAIGLSCIQPPSDTQKRLLKTAMACLKLLPKPDIAKQGDSTRLATTCASQIYPDSEQCMDEWPKFMVLTSGNLEAG